MMASDEKCEAADEVMHSSSDGEWGSRRQRGRWQCQDFPPDGSSVEGPMHKDSDEARGDLDRPAGDSLAKMTGEDVDRLPAKNENVDTEQMKEPEITDEFSTQDSNSNASQLSKTSRPNKKLDLEDQESQTKISKLGGGGSDKTETVTVVVIGCIVLFPYIMLWWSNPVAAWPALQMLLRLAFQSVAVAFATGLTLIGLQVHFSGTFFNQWATWLFQKKVDADSPNPVTEDAEKKGDVCSPDEVEETPSDNISLPMPENVVGTDKLNCSHSVGSQTEAADRPSPRTGDRARRYKTSMKKLYRKFQLIRRKCQSEMAGLRRSDREANAFLARVQMVLPGMERDKQALLAELQAIEKQYEEEKRRNHDLLTRLQRLNQHFQRLGQPQPSGATTTTTTATAAVVNAQMTDQQMMHNNHRYQQQPQPHVQHQMELQQQQQQQQQQQSCKQQPQQQFAQWQITPRQQNSPYPKLPFLAPVAVATPQHPSTGAHALQAQGFLQLQPPRPQQHFPHLKVLSQTLAQSPVVQATQQLQQPPGHGACRNSPQQAGQSQGMRAGLLQPK